MCVSVFQGSLLVNVIMIDGSENVIAKAAFELQSSRVFEKRSKRGKGLRKRSMSLPWRTCLHLTSHWISEASDLI